MSDLQAPAKLLVWVMGIVLSLGAVGSLGTATLRMAEAALEAQQHDQMSWGKFSRQLWGPHAQKVSAP